MTEVMPQFIQVKLDRANMFDSHISPHKIYIKK